MAEELRWALIVISVFVIGGLLIHGLWSVRKKDNPEVTQQDRVEPNEPTPSVEDTPEPVVQERDEPEFGDLSFSAENDQLKLAVQDSQKQRMADLSLGKDSMLDVQVTQRLLLNAPSYQGKAGLDTAVISTRQPLGSL